jgi:hypothetical protein
MFLSILLEKNIKENISISTDVDIYQNKPYFLKLINRGTNACYANSIVQALISLNNPLFDNVNNIVSYYFFSKY